MQFHKTINMGGQPVDPVLYLSEVCLYLLSEITQLEACNLDSRIGLPKSGSHNPFQGHQSLKNGRGLLSRTLLGHESLL